MSLSPAELSARPVPQRRRFAIEPLEDRLTPWCMCSPLFMPTHPFSFQVQSQSQFQFQHQSQSQFLFFSFSFTSPPTGSGSGIGFA
jgi:hypothetical protein